MPRLLCYYWAAHLSQHPTLGEAHLGQPAHCFHICESTAHLTRETQLTQAQPNTQLPNQQKEFTSRKWLKVCREVPRGKVDCARCFSWGWGESTHHITGRVSWQTCLMLPIEWHSSDQLCCLHYGGISRPELPDCRAWGEIYPKCTSTHIVKLLPRFTLFWRCKVFMLQLLHPLPTYMWRKRWFILPTYMFIKIGSEDPGGPIIPDGLNRRFRHHHRYHRKHQHSASLTASCSAWATMPVSASTRIQELTNWCVWLSPNA